MRLERVEPPSGQLSISGEAGSALMKPFEGWLALVGALYEMIGSPAVAGPSITLDAPTARPEAVPPG